MHILADIATGLILGLTVTADLADSKVFDELVDQVVGKTTNTIESDNTCNVDVESPVTKAAPPMLRHRPTPVAIRPRQTRGSPALPGMLPIQPERY